MDFPGWVNKYIDIPFSDFNCYELIRKVFYEQDGIDLPAYDQEYYSAMDGRRIRKIFSRELPELWQLVINPKAKDIVVCRIRNQPWHVGLVIAKGWMLHTEKGMNSVRERYDSPIWKNRVLGFYRYKG